MLLTFDIGNTNIVIGLFKGGELIADWRTETNERKTADEIGVFMNQVFKHAGIEVSEVENIIIASVVPHVMYSMLHMVHKYFVGIEPMIVGPKFETGIKIKYDNPKQVGADRIANAVGALINHKPPFIIVDFGTATTFCAINSECEYLGGAILPGIKISAEALFDNAAKLTRVELVKMDHVICTNTHQSIQAGIFFGYVGSVDNIVSQMKKELGEPNVTVIATGGLSTLIGEQSEEIKFIERDLTLQGLRQIFQLNNK